MPLQPTPTRMKYKSAIVAHKLGWVQKVPINLYFTKFWPIFFSHVTYRQWLYSSFVRFIRGGGWLLAVFQRAFIYRQRWGLDMAQWAIPL